MAGIIRCPKCNKVLVISRQVIKKGTHKGESPAFCVKCGYKTFIKRNDIK